MKEVIVKHTSGTGPIYGIGVLGALVYFLSHAQSFWGGLVGIVEAFFWPGVILYKVLELLKM